MKTDMPFPSILKLRTVLIVAAMASVVLAAISGIAYASPYAPLVFLGAIVAAGVLVAWAIRPVWALYAALLVVFLPLGLLPANLQSLLNRSLTVVAVGVWLLGLLIGRAKVVWTVPSLLMLLFLAWSSITLFWVPKFDPAINALQVYFLRFLLFLWLIPNEIRTRRDLGGLMAILALIGWVLMLSLTRTLVVEGYTAGSRLRVFGTNENFAGVLAMIALIGVLWLALRPSKQKSTISMILTLIYLGLTFALVTSSGSRGSALSLAITVAVLCFWRITRPWGRLSLLVGLLAIVLVPSLFITLVQRFTFGASDTLLGGREILWQTAWRVIQEHPLGGVGIGYGPYALVQYLQTDPRLVGLTKESFHNPILTVWVETGIPGILLYLGVLVSAVWSFVRSYLISRRNGPTWLASYFAVVSSVLLGYLISWVKGGGMESDFSYFFMMALLLVPAGLLAARAEDGEAQPPNQDQPDQA